MLSVKDMSKNKMITEEVSLPARFEQSGVYHPYSTLIIKYDTLRAEYLDMLKHLDQVYADLWATERLLIVKDEVITKLSADHARLYEANKYAVYGKPPPELSPVDENAI